MPAPSKSGTANKFKNIHHLLQDFYLLRRRIRITYEVGTLGISEAQILVQAFAEPGLNAKRLGEVLQLEKSTISRIVSGLIEKGHLLSKEGKDDLREKQIFVTDSGTRFVEQLQESNNHILRECLKNLSAREQFDLAHGMKVLADGLDCFAATYLPGDHPVTLEIVRLGRGTGMTGQNFMGSEFSSTQFHILRRFQLMPGTTVSELQTHLPLDISTLSRALSSLKDLGLVTAESSGNGARTSRNASYHLTKDGEKVVSDIDKKAEQLIEKGFSSAPPETAGRLQTLLEKVVEIPEITGTAVIQDRVEVRELATLEERQTARGLLLDRLIRTNSHFATPDEMFSPKNRSFGLFQNGNLVGACEVISHSSRHVLTNITALPQLEKQFLVTFEKTVHSLLALS